MSGLTQGQWDAERAKVKAKAAKVVKANAEKALKAKRKALGQPEPVATKASVQSEDLEAEGTEPQGTEDTEGTEGQ